MVKERMSIRNRVFEIIDLSAILEFKALKKRKKNLSSIIIDPEKTD